MPKFLNDVQLPADPTSSLEAATKQYVESVIANFPKGVLAYDIVTTNSASASSTATVLSGLDVTVNVDSSRCYRVVYSGAMQGSTNFVAPSGIQGRPAIKTGAGASTQLSGYERIALVSSTLSYGFELWYIDNAPTSGSKTYYGTFDRPGGTTGDTCWVAASATSPAFLYVEDMGAAL